eukprot:g4688.t1
MKAAKRLTVRTAEQRRLQEMVDALRADLTTQGSRLKACQEELETYYGLDFKQKHEIKFQSDTIADLRREVEQKAFENKRQTTALEAVHAASQGAARVRTEQETTLQAQTEAIAKHVADAELLKAQLATVTAQGATAEARCQDLEHFMTVMETEKRAAQEREGMKLELNQSAGGRSLHSSDATPPGADAAASTADHSNGGNRAAGGETSLGYEAASNNGDEKSDSVNEPDGAAGGKEAGNEAVDALAGVLKRLTEDVSVMDRLNAAHERAMSLEAELRSLRANQDPDKIVEATAQAEDAENK